MKDLIKETPETDDFAPIELGSVSEETKGIEGAPGENFVSLNSRD